MQRKVTLQDIADMAGVSRNTVSKILNEHFTGSQQIKDRVLNLMRENNYKGFGQLSGTENKFDDKTILLLSHGELAKSGFFLPLVNEIHQSVESRGCNLMLHGIQHEELEQQQIPKVIADHQIDGIMCIEIFHRQFIEKLLNCHIPIVFLEFYYDLWSIQGNYDVVLMNSEYPVRILTNQLLDQGCTNIGFVGDFTHCRGFYERYQGFCSALRDHNMSPMPQFCINYPDEKGYEKEGKLRKYLKAMDKIPDAFVVANDSIAIHLISILQEWEIQIPKEVQVISFDNITEAAHVNPPLTTVNSDTKELSQNVVGCLFLRMANPQRPRKVIYVDSEIIYRQSTKR